MERWRLLTKRLKLKELFDLLILSAKIGSTKNEQKIFEAALNKLNIKPEEAIFIDNTESNLKTAFAMGINTIFFDDKENDMRSLKKNLKMFGVK